MNRYFTLYAFGALAGSSVLFVQGGNSTQMGGANAVSRALCAYLLTTYILADEDFSSLRKRLAPLMRRGRSVTLTEQEKRSVRTDERIHFMTHKAR